MKDRRAEIAATADDAQWEWLRAHLERGGVIVVSPAVDLIDVAVTIANDEAAVVSEWIERGVIGRPSSLDITAWDSDPAKLFRMVVVSPYVLIQEKPTLQ